MPHDVTLISTIAVGFVFAFILGFVSNRLRLPPWSGISWQEWPLVFSGRGWGLTQPWPGSWRRSG
jgi:hypothetical protein